MRLHTGIEAEHLNCAVNAQAFTHGPDIYLGHGKDNLDSDAGKQLLAHELTHTIQQAGGGPVTTQRSPALIQRQPQSDPELQKRLAQVQKDLNTGSGVRSPESIAKLKAEEQDLLAALRQASMDELQRQLAANRREQGIGSGVWSPEAEEKLKKNQEELQIRLAMAGSVAGAARTVLPAGPGEPFID